MLSKTRNWHILDLSWLSHSVHCHAQWIQCSSLPYLQATWRSCNGIVEIIHSVQEARHNWCPWTSKWRIGLSNPLVTIVSNSCGHIILYLRITHSKGRINKAWGCAFPRTCPLAAVLTRVPDLFQGRCNLHQLQFLSLIISPKASASID